MASSRLEKLSLGLQNLLINKQLISINQQLGELTIEVDSASVLEVM